MINGRALGSAVVFLTAWLVLLCGTLWKLLKTPSPEHKRHTTRTRLTVSGIGFCIAAVAALLALHLSWVSVMVSQHLGVAAVRILSLVLFWSTIAGLAASAVGAGRLRWVGVASTLVTGFWWLVLFMGTAISMGSPIARHPTIYLVPQGYVGWVKIQHGEKAPPLEMSNGAYMCRIPANGILQTSSSLEDGWAKDEYFYYSEDGTRALPNTGWGRSGMIWGGRTEWQLSGTGGRPAQFSETFFVGREDQYRSDESRKPKPLRNTISH